MMQLFNTLLYQPLLNVLVFFYNLVPDIGVAIIFLTIFIKTILWPLTLSTYKSQARLRALQPETKRIQEKYKNNRAELSKALMELYKKEKISPFSSLLPMLIQFPFLIAIYKVFRAGLDPGTNLPLLYPFIENPEHLSPYFLGMINLAVPSFVIALLTGIAQFFQTKMMPQFMPKTNNIPGSRDEKMTTTMNRQMTYFMPAFTVIIGMSIPAGLTFYWLLTTLLTIFQQWIFFKPKPTPQTRQ